MMMYERTYKLHIYSLSLIFEKVENCFHRDSRVTILDTKLETNLERKKRKPVKEKDDTDNKVSNVPWDQ